MKYIKYLIWYFALLAIKPIIKATLQEIEEGSRALALMRWKEVKDAWKEIKIL